MARFFIVMAISCFLSACSRPQALHPKIAEIDRNASILDSAMRKDSNRVLFFADTTDYTIDSIPHWTQFPNNAAIASDYHEDCGQAVVYKANDNSTETYFINDDESLDWTYYITSYYRPDGTIAKVDAELRIFYGRVDAETVEYYDESGRLIKKSKQFRDLNTDKHLRKPSQDFIDEPLQVFYRVSDLPFSHLISH